MANAKVGLGSITQVAANTTTAVYTVGSAKLFISEILKFIVWMHQHCQRTSSCSPELLVVVGTASSITRIARLGISTHDTYFFENAYPITLTDNGDTVQIYNENTADAVNVLVLGDKEV